MKALLRGVRASLPPCAQHLVEPVRRAILYHVGNALAQSPHLDRDDLVRHSLTAVWAAACSSTFILRDGAATYLGNIAKFAIKREVYFLSWKKESKAHRRTEWVLRQIGRRVPEEKVLGLAARNDRSAAEMIRWVRILKVLGVLTRREARVCILHYVYGYTAEEIATKIGTTPGTIGTTRHRALETLRGVCSPYSFNVPVARRAKKADGRRRTPREQAALENAG